MLFFSKRCQNQCKPNAENSLFVEAKPDFAGLFSKSAAKVLLFSEIPKYLCHFFEKTRFSAHFLVFFLRI
jgi:hypothetical protein